MTEDRLIQHRLQALEEMAAGWHAAERRVDALSMSLAAVERTAMEIQSEMRDRDKRLDAGLKRIHERLDETLRERAREEGREEGRVLARAEVEATAKEAGRQVGLGEARRTTWKVVGFTITATIMASGVVLALLGLLLK